MFLKRIEKGWVRSFGIFEAKEYEEVTWVFSGALSYPERTFFVEPGERVRIRLKRSDHSDLLEVGDHITLRNLIDNSNYKEFHWYVKQ